MPKLCKYAVPNCCGQPPLCNIEPGAIKCKNDPDTCEIMKRVEELKKKDK